MSTQEFIQVYDRYSDKIFRHCFFRIHDRELALDLMQDTFTKTWTYMQDGKDVENMQAFLYKVANNLLLDYYRKKKSASLEEMEENDGFVPSVNDLDHLQAKIDADSILEIVKKIPEKYASVLIMRYVDEMSPKEIADVINESENVVSVRLHRATSQLRKLIKS